MPDKTEHYEMEAALIGAIMADEVQFEEVKDFVSKDAFDWLPYKNAWAAIERLKARGLGVDVITLGDELQRNEQLENFITHHTKTPDRTGLGILRRDADPRQTVTYATKVMDYSAKRAIIPALEEAAYWSNNGRYASDIKRDLAIRLDEIKTFDGKSVKSTVSMRDATAQAEDRTDKASRGEIINVETGFEDFDDMLGGGAEGGDFIIVGGRPGTGKSSMLASIAINAAKKKKRVAYFSLEMGAQQIAMRMISMISGVSYVDQKRGTLDDADWPRYIHGVEVLNSLDIEIIDLAAITMSQTRQALRAMKSVDIAVFDYIQLARPDEPQGNREREISFISQSLKQIAREFDFPMFAGAQLSRDIEKRSIKRPVLSDLRESGSLEQDSDIVTFLHKPDEDLNAYEWIVAKHRNGPVGSVPLVFIPNKTLFESGKKRHMDFNPLYTS